MDSISKDYKKVCLRDPYHGWKITVTGEAFMKRFGTQDDIIQVDYQTLT